MDETAHEEVEARLSRLSGAAVVPTFRNTVFRSDVQVPNLLEGGVWFQDCEFRQEFDLSESTVRGSVKLEGCTFLGSASFKAASVAGNITISNCTFQDELGMADCDIGLSLFISHSSIRKPVGLSRIKIGKDLDLRGSITGDLLIDGASIGRNVQLGGGRFQGEVSLDEAKIGGALYVRPTVQETYFGGNAIFSDIEVGTVAEFDSVVFRGKVDFGRARIGATLNLFGVHFAGRALFNGMATRAIYAFPNEGGVPTTFRSDVWFVEIDIEGNVLLIGIDFEGTVVFSRAKIGGDLSFTDLTSGQSSRFRAAVKFQSLRILGNLGCQGVLFGADADFYRLHVAGNASFAFAESGRRTAFLGPANFNRAEFVGEALFDGTVFAGPASFISCIWGEFTRFGRDIFGRFTTFDTSSDFSSSRFIGQAEFTEVRFEGICKFHACTFEHDVSFKSSWFGSELDCHGAVFSRAFFMSPGDSLRRVEIGGKADFAYSRFGMQADFSRTVFHSSAVFVQAQFVDNAVFELVRFEGVASFERATVNGVANFRGDQTGFVTMFFRDVILTSATINGDAWFDGAQFFGSFTAIGLTVGGDVRFTDRPLGLPTVFYRGSRWDRLKVGGDSSFSGAIFGGEAVFDGMEAKGSVTFAAGDWHAAMFLSDAYFRRSQFQGKFDFADVDLFANLHFNNSQVLSSADLSGVLIRGEAGLWGVAFGDTFNMAPSDTSRPARIYGPALFQASTFGGIAMFAYAHFKGIADYAGARFSHNAYWNNATLDGGLDLSATSCAGDFHFEDAQIRHLLDMSQSRIVSLFVTEEIAVPDIGLSANRPTFDLRGTTFERAYANWRLVLSSQDPFDRQPYAQFEQAYRRIGDDSQANAVFFELRSEELRRRLRLSSWTSWWKIPWDVGSRMISGYGVRPLRILICAALIITIGTLVYSRPESVEVGIDADSAILAKEGVGTLKAMQVTVDQLLPLDVPGSRDLQPSDEKFLDAWGLAISYSDFASLMAILGWILVPVSLAVLIQALLRQRISLPE